MKAKFELLHSRYKEKDCLRLSHVLVLRQEMLTLTVVSKHGRSVTLVAHALEGALCVPALPVRAEVTVLTFVNICERNSTEESSIICLGIGTAVSGLQLSKTFH